MTKKIQQQVAHYHLMVRTAPEASPSQSTYIYRAPAQCMSPRWNWDSPTPLAASECALPPGPKGGGAQSPAAKGVGESQFQRMEKRLALCLLCALPSHWSLPLKAGTNEKM
jgi:hypothetical protein